MKRKNNEKINNFFSYLGSVKYEKANKRKTHSIFFVKQKIKRKKITFPLNRHYTNNNNNNNYKKKFREGLTQKRQKSTDKEIV